MDKKNLTKPKKANHHTNPKFVLNSFSNNGVLRKMDRKGKIRQSGIHVATVVKHFHTIFEANDPDLFEDTIATSFEKPAANIFKKIISSNSWPLNKSDNVILSNFLALQILRSPILRSDYMQYLKVNFVEPTIVVDNKNILVPFESIQYHLETSQMTSFFGEFGPVISNQILDMTKILVNFDDDSLLTSAQPITMMFDGDYLKNMMKFSDSDSPGAYIFGEPKKCSALFYALSRKKAIIIVPEQKINSSLIINGHHDLARGINRLTSMFCEEVFFHPDDNQYFIEWYLDDESGADIVDLLKFVNSLSK